MGEQNPNSTLEAATFVLQRRFGDRHVRDVAQAVLDATGYDRLVRSVRMLEAENRSRGELEHERDLLREIALRVWNEVLPSEKHRELMVSLGFVLSMTGDRELRGAVSGEPGDATK